MQPGMAGGGLTSIPLNMHHDFAAGGIIAFAGGGTSGDGEADLAAQYPEQSTIEQERAERLKQQEAYGFGGDPYAEAKRRYAEIEARQNAREKNADSDRFWSGLATYAAAGPKSFAEAAGGAAQHMEKMEKEQEAEGDTRRAKMAELNTLWAKEQDALARANYEADRGNVEGKRKKMLEAANYRAELRKVAAQEKTAGASAQNAKTAEEQRKFEQEKYPEKFELERLKTEADLARARRPDEFQQRLNLFKTNPQAYNAMFGDKAFNQQTSREEAIKNLIGRMGPKFTMLARSPEGLEQQEALIKREMSGGAPTANKPTGAPAVGTIQGGYRFKGGDPGSPSSWEKV
jgi:hypothetical protein